jgi:hypothetical protein
MNNVLSLSRRLGLGRLWLEIYHRPLGRLRNVYLQGGPFAIRETERQRREMEMAARELPPLPQPDSDSPLCVHVLTGKRFWYQTAFCVHSLVQSAGCPIRVEIYDDGSLDPAHLELLKRLGPALRIHAQKEAIDRLDTILPKDRFPTLRALWQSYPHIRKLTDIHAGTDGWKLVIDSDLLFFRCPQVLIDWMRSPDRPLHGVDCVESYGYSRSLMEELCGAEIPPLVNVGLCGLRSEAIDWVELEMWCNTLIAREKASYFLEQALVAMIVARSPVRTVAPAMDYVTMPDESEVRAPRGVMHHYVAESKRWYFMHGWRHAVRSASPGRAFLT